MILAVQQLVNRCQVNCISIIKHISASQYMFVIKRMKVRYGYFVKWWCSLTYFGNLKASCPFVLVFASGSGSRQPKITGIVHLSWSVSTCPHPQSSRTSASVPLFKKIGIRISRGNAHFYMKELTDFVKIF